MSIHYRRPPDGEHVFHQRLVHADADVLVTLAERVELDRPVVVEGKVVLEAGADAVWFTFPGRWHDVGRFHDRAGRFTGLYANVLTPPRIEPGHVWHTTDLFLDVWIGLDGRARTLDADELDLARREGWVDEEIARRAEEEARALVAAHRRGTWPPPVVDAWTLGRARAAARGGGREDPAGRLRGGNA